MRRGSPIALAALIAFSVLPSARLSAQATGTITGAVTDADTGRPLPNVRVSVVDGTRAALTDQNGRYRIADVPAGEYVLRAEGFGWSPAEAPVRLGADLLEDPRAVTIIGASGRPDAL